VQDVDVVKTPVPLLDDQLTDPVGEEPVTLAVHVEDAPGVTDAGAQLTATLDDTLVTPIEKVPELPRLPESPPYVPVMVGVPAPLSLYVTEQLPELKVHDVEGENDEVPLELENDTVPVGEEPDTVAVHEEDEELATVIELGAQLTEVDVVACDPPVMVMGEVVPELAMLAGSPP
jgi:hypothetical protein